MRGNPPGPTHTALPLLAVAAGATERIRVASTIVLAPFYHPTVLAKLATTLDIASGGRLTLGIGVGGEYPVEFEAAGLNVRQRGRRTNECLEALRRLWTEENVSYQGRNFRLDDVTLLPRPTQQPHPPVWVSGRRDAAMSRAARYGDGWMPYFYDPARYRDSVEKIRGIRLRSRVAALDELPMGLFPVHLHIRHGGASGRSGHKGPGGPVSSQRGLCGHRASLLPAWPG